MFLFITTGYITVKAEHMKHEVHTHVVTYVVTHLAAVSA